MERLDELDASFFEAFRPPRKLRLSEWADQNAILSAESSAEAGRWRTIPYQKGIMDAFTESTIEMVVVMKSARVGWTKILNHVIGYHIHQDPCSIMVVQPTIEDAEGYSKEEIAPMIRDTPALVNLVSEAKAKDGSNTILAKNYPGGTLSMVGANSPRGFRRVSRRIVLFDETDGYPASAGPEGDQIKLGIRRTEYFWNRKIGAGSTPTVKGLSRIERLFEQGDQRRYFVPCPQCGDRQYLKWRNLKWPESEPAKAYFVCEKNGCVISHDKKRWMVENGSWEATAPGNGKTASFHIWAAYSYSPNASWGILAQEFLEAKSNPESLKTFVNTVLGECWEEEYTARIGAEGLRQRVENYAPGTIPAGGLVLTAGVDVQDNRLAIKIDAWAEGEECWTIQHQEIYGDPARPEIWKQLDDVIVRTYRHEMGSEMPVSVVCVDSGGHYTHEVYQYVRERKRLIPKTFVLAVKGSSQKGKPAIGKPSKQDVNYRGQSLKSGVDLYMVGSDTIKTTIYGKMKFEKPGPGYLHFYGALTDEFFEQLTSERKITKYSRGGFPVSEWVKPPGKRNEALDCAVYSYAALQFLYTRYNRATIWKQLAAKLPGAGKTESVTPDQAKSTEAVEPSLQKQPARRNIIPNRRGGGFVTGY